MLSSLKKVLSEKITSRFSMGAKAILEDKDYMLFAIVYLVQGSFCLTTVSFPLFLREDLHLTPFQVTTFIAAYGILWSIKPLYGLITDLFPIFGRRRKPYIFIFSALAALAWGIVAFYPPTYNLVMVCMFLQSLGIAFVDVVCDGRVIERSTDETAGKIQSLVWGSRMVGAMITGFLGGALIPVIGYQGIFLIMAIMPMLIFIVALFIEEEKVESVVEKASKVYPKFKSFCKGLKNPLKRIEEIALEYRSLLLASAFIMVFNMFPHFTTSAGGIAPFTLFMRESLGFSKPFLGALITILSFGKLMGIIFYALFVDGIDLRKVLKWSAIIGSLVTLFALLMFNPYAAVIIHLCWGIVGYIAFLPVMTLAVRSCPKHMEATAYATLMSVGNFGGTFAVFSSGFVYDYMGGLNALIIMSAIGGLLVLPFIKYLKVKDKKKEG